MAETRTIEIELFIDKAKEGLYFKQPFEVPEGVERIDIRYSYPREENIIDLSLASCHDGYLGSSGSDRSHIWISDYSASEGYAPVPTFPGTWHIIVGAYKVQGIGVKVTYTISFTYKERRLLKGDCHMHSTGSDGILTVEELVMLGKKNKLDFLFITDHNNYAHNDALKSTDTLTLIPGVEWTHFKGHANFLGVKRPFGGSFIANTLEEAQSILQEAKSNGALISANHPFDYGCPWKWGLENFEFDCVEIWNGIIKGSDMKCIAWWHHELCQGRRLPIIGGSDFHRFQNFGSLGVPTTCLYSMSRGPDDILDAIRQGHGYVTFQPEAPEADILCGDYRMGEAVPYNEGLTVIFEFHKVQTGDILKIYSTAGLEKEMSIEHPGNFRFEIAAENRHFYRAELYRQLLPHLPPMLYLITNPIYFK